MKMKHKPLGQSKKRAFIRGFWGGLAAPVALFSVHVLPDASSVTIKQVANPNKQSRGLRGDWVQVGSDLRGALREDKLRHG